MELRSEVSQRTKVPAHAGTSPNKALPNKIQLNGKAYTAIQGGNGLEPPGMGQHELILEDKPQECMAGKFLEKKNVNLKC